MPVTYVASDSIDDRFKGVRMFLTLYPETSLVFGTYWATLLFVSFSFVELHPVVKVFDISINMTRILQGVRKSGHNAIEKRYRSSINDRCSNIYKHLPSKIYFPHPKIYLLFRELFQRYYLWDFVMDFPESFLVKLWIRKIAPTPVSCITISTLVIMIS